MSSYSTGLKHYTTRLFVFFLILSFSKAYALQLDYKSPGEGSALVEIDIDTGPWNISDNEASFEGASRLHVEGYPDYPVIRKWIVLPDGIADLEIQSVEYEWMGPFRCSIAPYVNPGFDSGGGKASLKREFPVRVFRIGKPVVSGGTRAVSLLILPVRPIPCIGELAVSRRIMLACRTIRSKNARPSGDSYRPPMLGFHDSLNQSTFDEDTLDEYLVLAGAGFVDSPSLLDFTTWKRENGFDVFVVDSDTVGADSGEIKELIRNRYEKGCRNVLFIGDVIDIPMHDLGSYSSDHWYACVDGDDDLADLRLGRLSVGSEEELSIQVSKILGYQKGSGVFGWVESVALIADKEDYPRKYTACKDSVSTGVYPGGDFEFHKVYGGDGKTNCDIDHEFTLGAGLVNYRGHGSFTSWYNWGADGREYGAEDVEKQMNFSRHPVVFSITCYTGALDYRFGNCFIEALLDARGGASGALGATSPTWTGVNHSMDRRIFEYLLETPGVRVMDAVNRAKEYIILHEGQEGIENANKYLWLGDPDMFVWTASPGAMELTAPYSIRMNSGFFTVEIADKESGLPVQGAKAVLLDENRTEVHDVSFSDASGIMLLEIPAVEPSVLQLVVTNPGYAPAYETLKIVNGLGPFVEARLLEDQGILMTDTN